MATGGWDPRNTYDVTEKELDLMKKRATIRSQLKAHWIKESTNPYLRQFGGFVFDPQVQRLMAAQACRQEYYKPNAKNHRFFFLTLVVPWVIFYKLVTNGRNWREEQLMSGTVAYQDKKGPIDAFRS